MAALYLLHYNNTFNMYQWNFFCQKRESDVMDCCAFRDMNPHSVKLPTQTQPSKIFKFSICKYESYLSYKPQIHCKFRGNMCHMWNRSEQDALLWFQPRAQRRMPFQSPSQGDAVGILWLSYCDAFKPHLGTKIVSSLYSWFSKIIHYKHNFHSEWPQSLEKALASPLLPLVFHFTKKLLTSCPERFA